MAGISSPAIAGSSVTITGTVDVNLASSAITLPVSVSGVATAANQSTEIASLASIDGKLPVLGQALAASSVPVVLTAAQLSTLTPPAAITGFATAANQTTQITAEQAIQTAVEILDNIVSGSEAQVDIVSMPAVDTELTTGDFDTGAGTDTRAVVGIVGSASGGGQIIPGTAADGLLVNLGANNDVTLTSTTITGTVAVTQSGTWDEVGINDSGNSITVDNAGTFAVQDSQDVMLGTDFSSVFGTASLVTATQADDLANTTDGVNVTALNYVFDGTTWDRAKGDSTDGALVNLGANNDVTVTGSVTANAGTNLNTSALLTSSDFAAAFGTAGTADTQVLSVQGIASMTPVQVSQATASNLNATVVGTGTFAVQDATAQASLSVMDDWDESDRAKTNPIVGQAGVAAGVGATGATVQRIVVANDAGRTLVSKGGTAASSGDNTLVAAGTNRLKVYAFSLSTVSTTAVTCIFQSGASGTEVWRVILQTPASVAGGANLVVQPPAWLFATASATLLNLSLSAAVTVHYSISYWDEA